MPLYYEDDDDESHNKNNKKGKDEDDNRHNLLFLLKLYTFIFQLTIIKVVYFFLSIQRKIK